MGVDAATVERALAALTPAEAAELDALLMVEHPLTFREWLPRVSPEMRWDWPHLRLSQDRCEDITAGRIQYLIELMPPRHGKTEQGTVRYPAHRLEQDLGLRTIIAAYNQTLAEKFSRKVRRLARARGIALNPERNTAADWETLEGGGVRAVGVGGGVTGQGGDLIIVDDPVKSRAEAESLVYRERLWEWFTQDIWTRREPGAAVIIRVTPWHHDDLVGRILADPEIGPMFTVVRLPALAEADDPLGRAEGEALCPDRFPADELQRIRTVLGEYAFSGLYQCRPTPRGGGMFPRDKVAIVPASPAHVKRRVRAWDKAGTADGGKRTCGVRMALGDDGLVYVEDCVLGQWDAARREAVILQTATIDGAAVPIELEQEPGSGGKESAQSSVRNLSGFTVRATTATGDKATRADPFAAQWQAGNVRLVAGDWNKLYLDDMELSPHGKFLDEMDASAMAFNALHRVTGGTLSQGRARYS